MDISGASFLYKDNVYYLTLPNISTTKANYKLIYDLLSSYFNFILCMLHLIIEMRLQYLIAMKMQ